MLEFSLSDRKLAALMSLTPVKSLVFGLTSSGYSSVNDIATTTAFNNAHLGFGNLTPSNVTAHSTPPTMSLPSTSESSMLSNAINSNYSNDTQRQMGRSNGFEVPIWLILCYGVILLCAIVGNLLVISTLVQNRRMRTITNVFLLNLAISDILLGVLCMPVTLVGTLLRHFIFGEFLCKLIQFSQAASVAISSWTLVAISCERYYAICHPLRSRRWQTRSHAYKIIGFIWCGSMLCMLPIAMFSQLMPTSRQGLRKCRENWPSFARPYERSYNIFLDLILLVVPLIILIVAYFLIIRTLYVGMRIEKAMIFGGRPEHLHSSLHRKSYGRSYKISHLKLNLSLRYHDKLKTAATTTTTTAAVATNAAYSNTNSFVASTQRRDTTSNTSATDLFLQQQQLAHQQQHQEHLHHPELPPAQLRQQHTFESDAQQKQLVLGEEGPKQQQQQPGCEPLARLGCRSCASAHSGQTHLYCMRFATLKATLPDKEECCSGSDSTATLNVSTKRAHLSPATTASPTATRSASCLALPPAKTSTMYRYQMHQPLQHYQLQTGPGGCGCVMPPEDGKKCVTKRSLKATESVLRRNNIAKNLESKKRVVKMLFVLVLEFFICWTPLYIINTMAMYIGAAIYEYIDYTSISALQLLAYSSSCCNPITYCFMNANFRRAFWDTFKGMQWCGNRFKRNRSATDNGTTLCLVGSVRANSCTVQTEVMDSPRL